jgi:hypothetical protein
MHEKLIEAWRQESIRLRPPATLEEIADCERHISFSFPADFKNFYLQVDGFEPPDMDDRDLNLWSIDQIKAAFDPDYEFIAFVGGWFNVRMFGFIKGESGVFCTDNFLQPVAISFDDFLTDWLMGTLPF